MVSLLKRRRHAVAETASVIFNPMAYCTWFLVALTVWHPTWFGASILLWAGFVAAPGLLLAVGRRAGVWSDWDVTQLRERRTYMPGVAIFSGATAWAAWTFRFPSPLRLVASAIFVWLLVSTIIGFWWKISLHAGGTMGILLLALYLIGPFGALAVVWVPPLVAWSRLALSRHSPAQVVAGAATGAMSVIGVWYASGLSTVLH